LKHKTILAKAQKKFRKARMRRCLLNFDHKVHQEKNGNNTEHTRDLFSQKKSRYTSARLHTQEETARINAFA
jgi:hypothetical protein